MGFLTSLRKEKNGSLDLNKNEHDPTQVEKHS